MKRFVANCLALPVLAIAFAAQAQTVPIDLEAGYRWLDLKGDNGMYRTQVNERGGLLIRNLTLATSDFDGHTSLVDRFRVDISDLGVGPAQSVRLEASRSDAYRLRLSYRATDAFSALPAFANPLFGQGIVPGQHIFDRTRKMVDVDLELLPEKAVTPFVGYSWNNNNGPGQTTYHLGQDEFSLLQNSHERDREIRGGASFHFASISGQVTEGLRTYSSSDSVTLAPGAGGGNDPGTVLGQPVTASSITRTDSTHVSTPFTNIYVAAQVWKQVRLIGNYSRFAADSNGTESEAAAGSFVSFALSRFFNGLTESAASTAKNTTWRGGGRTEINIAPNVDVLAGYQREHREMDGTAFLDSMFLQSITFAGFDRRDIETVLKATSSVERNEDVWNAAISARAVGPFALRGEIRESKQDFTVAPDLSEIVVPGSQGGDFNRHVRTYDLNGTYTHSGLLLGASWRSDHANQSVFRTDFLDRDRLRLRAGWSTPNKMFRIGTTAERTVQSNDPSIGYDAHVRQLSGDVDYAPIQQLRFHASASQFRASSNISIRHPENFTLDGSMQRENGQSREGGVSFLQGPFSLDASLARFENRGSNPFSINRHRIRFTWDFKWKTGIAAEWDQEKYSEPAPSYGDFDANRYGVYLRWHP